MKKSRYHLNPYALIIWGMATFFSAMCWSVVAHAEIVLFPRSELQRNQYDGFPVKLLLEALKAANASQYQLKPTEFYVVSENAFNLLQLNRVQVMWEGKTEVDNKNVVRLQTPIMKGYMGWRIMMLPAAYKEILRDVRTLEQLAKYPVLSSPNWPETQYYRHSGFKVIEMAQYDKLFEKLTASAPIMFPRMVLSISKEYANRQHLDIAIDPFVLLKYPYTLHFYVSAAEPELIAAIQKGLQRLQSSGMHDKLLLEHYGDISDALDIDQRHVIEMPVN